MPRVQLYCLPYSYAISPTKPLSNTVAQVALDTSTRIPIEVSDRIAAHVASHITSYITADVAGDITCGSFWCVDSSAAASVVDVASTLWRYGYAVVPFRAPTFNSEPFCRSLNSVPNRHGECASWAFGGLNLGCEGGT